jgi:hypothetical protein
VPTIPVLIAVPVAPTTVVEFWPGNGTVDDSAKRVVEEEDAGFPVEEDAFTVEEEATVDD